MKAVEANLLGFLKKSPQFQIPIYQRTYSWTDRECQQLWDDILRVGRNDSLAAHFIGSIVYVESGLYQVSGLSPLLVIDGQQRLTTILLLLEALARQLGDKEVIDGFSARKLRNYYLLNPEESGDRHFKLLLTQTDKDTLLALVQQKHMPANPSLRITENFAFFRDQVKALGDDISSLCKGLGKLLVVDIALNREQDNPQLIFESMNSTGRELSQADLIRNFILMGLDPEKQTALYQYHWRPMEESFGQEAYGEHFDKFMRHYLTVRTGEIPKVGAVYEAFKQYADSLKSSSSNDELVAEIHQFSDYYCAMALGKETDKELEAAFQDLRELRVDVSYPLLLDLYHAYQMGDLDRSVLLAILRLVESYVFRRAICSIPTNTLNKTFATFMRSIDRNMYLESVQAHLLSLTSYRRFPNNDEFQQDIKVRDLYAIRNRTYLFRRLENHGRKERVEVNEYTIEHIMPQNPNLSSQWQADLGPEWRRVQETWLHTLGNLTLTGYNAEYSDRPFAEKRDMTGGFGQSPLKLNQGLAQLEQWNEVEIVNRASRLAAQAVWVWSIPSLSEDVVQQYQPKQERLGGYSIDHHQHLAKGTSTRAIFDVFRQDILALDPSITEEFLKLYVAYKAETNFVDIVPQAKRLRLSLNMPFHELHDPRGIAKDVANVGRWGNGDVEVGLDKVEDIPYVLGLVRQSLERQIGGSSEDGLD